MFWDLIQQSQIQAGAARAERADAEAMRASNLSLRASTEVAQLRRDVSRLSLACAAMHELLKQHGLLDDDGLRSMMLELDRRDGKLDGRHAKPTRPCPQCTRANADHREACVFCGASLAPGSAFP